MTEHLQHFGTPCILPESIEVGDCAACGGVMYDYESVPCPNCGELIHRECIKKCAQCRFLGCSNCLVKYDGEYFCDTTGPDGINQSDCKDEYIKEVENANNT